MPHFVQLVGERAGESFTATDGAVLGRDASCDITFGEASVSRRHARLIQGDGEWRLVDMKSHNGLFLGERRIESCVLRSGDEVTLGKLRLRFHLDDDEDSAGFERLSCKTMTVGDLAREMESREDKGGTVSAPGSARERRGERIAVLQDGGGGGIMSGDLLQRPAWVRWSLYALIAAISIGGCIGAYLLVQKLRG